MGEKQQSWRKTLKMKMKVTERNNVTGRGAEIRCRSDDKENI